MRKIILVVVLLMTAIWLTAQTAPEHPAQADGPGVKLPSGLKYWDLKVGTGTVATKGKKVRVNYTGWLLEGTRVDSSYDRNTPFEFKLGAGKVIKGWDEGVAGMKVGGKRQLRIPPDLGYGIRGAEPAIPPNAYLVFDVELLDVK